MMMVASISAYEFFNAYELEQGGNPFVDANVSVRHMLSNMHALPSPFKNNYNLTLPKFKELCTLVMPIKIEHARSISVARKVSGRPMKLSPENRILNFILYMKYSNWLRSSLCDDAFFIASCINLTMVLKGR